jgi:hypothetical protein
VRQLGSSAMPKPPSVVPARPAASRPPSSAPGAPRPAVGVCAAGRADAAPPSAPGRRARATAGRLREVGVYRRHGKLDGLWRDCVIVEKLLGGFCDIAVG